MPDDPQGRLSREEADDREAERDRRQFRLTFINGFLVAVGALAAVATVIVSIQTFQENDYIEAQDTFATRTAEFLTRAALQSTLSNIVPPPFTLDAELLKTTTPSPPMQPSSTPIESVRATAAPDLSATQAAQASARAADAALTNTAIAQVQTAQITVTV